MHRADGRPGRQRAGNARPSWLSRPAGAWRLRWALPRGIRQLLPSTEAAAIGRALALPWRDFRPNYQTLLWFAGIYPLILGVSLLLLPDTSVGWNALRHLHGGLSVLSGIALLWAVGTTRS